MPSVANNQNASPNPRPSKRSRSGQDDQDDEDYLSPSSSSSKSSSKSKTATINAAIRYRCNSQADITARLQGLAWAFSSNKIGRVRFHFAKASFAIDPCHGDLYILVHLRRSVPWTKWDKIRESSGGDEVIMKPADSWCNFYAFLEGRFSSFASVERMVDNEDVFHVSLCLPFLFDNDIFVDSAPDSDGVILFSRIWSIRFALIKRRALYHRQPLFSSPIPPPSPPRLSTRPKIVLVRSSPRSPSSPTTAASPTARPSPRPSSSAASPPWTAPHPRTTSRRWGCSSYPTSRHFWTPAPPAARPPTPSTRPPRPTSSCATTFSPPPRPRLERLSTRWPR